jgi:hypothetical protein
MITLLRSDQQHAKMRRGTAAPDIPLHCAALSGSMNCYFSIALYLPMPCRSWTLSAATTALLDHKGTFSDHAASMDLLVPQHHVVTSPQQLQQLNSEEV